MGPWLKPGTTIHPQAALAHQPANNQPSKLGRCPREKLSGRVRVVGGGRWWTVVGHGGLGMGVLTTWRRFPLPPSNVLQVLIFPRIQITFLLFALYDRKLKVQIGGGGGGGGE